MPSIVQELDKLIAQAGGTPSGSGLSINEKLKQLNGLIGGTPANIFTYKGSVATADLLPTSGQSVGDVYNIISESDYGPAGTNVAWAGEAWDSLGGTSSGSDALVVIFTKSGSTYSVNVSSSEIYEAWSSERQIVAIDKSELTYLKIARIGMVQSLFYSNVEFSAGPNYSGTLSDRKYEIRWNGSRDTVSVSNRTIQVPNTSNLSSKTYCLSYYYNYDGNVYDKTKKILTSVSGAPMGSMSGFVYEYESQGINIIDVTDPRANFDFDTQTDSAYDYYFSISDGSSDYIVPDGIIKHVSSISNYISDEQEGGTAKLVLSGFDSSLSDAKEEYTITASYNQDYEGNCIIFTDKQESSGGSDLVTVKFKATSSSGSAIACISHTFEELYAAIEAGANVIAYLYNYDGTLSKYNSLSGSMNNRNRPGVYLLHSYSSYGIDFYATYQGSYTHGYREAAVMFPSALMRFSSDGTCSFYGNTSNYATMRGVYWYDIVLDSETNKKMIDVTYPTEIQNMFTYRQVNFNICFFDNTVTTVYDPFNEFGPAPLEYIKHLVAISRTDLSSDPQEHHEWEYTFILSYWDSANNQLAYEKYVGVYNDSTLESAKTLQVTM